MVIRGLVTMVVAVLVGCAAGPTKSGVVRPADPLARQVERQIPRGVYRDALAQTALMDGIRLVPIYRRNQEFSEDQPEWRLFDIQKGSAYEMLGLQTADVLVSAHGYVVPRPETFKQYVQLLLKEPEARIEIRRDGTPLVVRTVFTETGK